MLLALKIFFRGLFKRKQPLFMFTSPGIDEDGRVQLEMAWNDEFIKHIREHGFVGHNEEECAQMFLMSFTRAVQGVEDVESVNSDAHPFLNQETGNIVKR